MLITFGKTINLNKPAMTKEKPSPLEGRSLLTPLMADTVCFGKIINKVDADKVEIIRDFLSHIYDNWQNAKPVPSYEIKKKYYKQYAIELSGQTYLFKNSYKPGNEYFIIENLSTGGKITQTSLEASKLLNVQYSFKENEFSLNGSPKNDDMIKSLKSMLEIIYVITLQTNQRIDPKRITAFLNVIAPNPFKQ